MSLDVEESDVAFKLASGDGAEFEIPIEAARQSVILTKVLSSGTNLLVTSVHAWHHLF
jgi:hypothetical protein